METNDIVTAIKIIEQYKEIAHFSGGSVEAELVKAESRIGARFPASYRNFLLKLGCGSFGPEEFMGIPKSDIEIKSVPNGIWVTLQARNSGLPPHLFVVSYVGDGALYVLELVHSASKNPGAVYSYVFSADRDSNEENWADFGEFFLDQIRKVAEQK